MTPEDIRYACLAESVRSFVDMEQPRTTAQGYSTGNRYNTAPTTEDILSRAKSFAAYVRGDSNGSTR
jgi:hypothetical protein